MGQTADRVVPISSAILRPLTTTVALSLSRRRMCASCASVRKSASRADSSATRDVDGAGGIGRDLASIHRVYRPSAHSSLVYHRKWDEKHSRARLCDTSSAAAEMDSL